MKNIKALAVILVLPVLLFLSGCVNLKKVNDFSSNSVKSLKKFEELGYGFTNACNDKCRIEQFEKAQLPKNECACASEKEADRVTMLIYNAIKGYFEGLTRLSNNELTEYKFDALSKALKEEDLGDIRINKEHVDSYTKISGILTKAVTDSYRKRKLSTYIDEANDAVKILLNALEFNLVSNLSGILDVKKQRLESYYFDLSADPAASGYEKKKIIEEYNTSLAEIESKKKQIAAFGKALKTIAEAHQKLYANRYKLNSREIRELLSQYASEIQDISDELNKLNQN